MQVTTSLDNRSTGECGMLMALDAGGGTEREVENIAVIVELSTRALSHLPQLA